MGLGQSVRKFADRAKDKIRPEQAERGVDQVADKFNRATGGKHASKVTKARQKAKDTAGKYFQGGK